MVQLFPFLFLNEIYFVLISFFWYVFIVWVVKNVSFRVSRTELSDDIIVDKINFLAINLKFVFDISAKCSSLFECSNI